MHPDPTREAEARCSAEGCTTRAIAGGKNDAPPLCLKHLREWINRTTPIPRRSWWSAAKQQAYDKDPDAFGRADAD